MKKLLVTFLLATTSLFAQPTNYPGSGTEADPWQVSTVAQFDSIRYSPDAAGPGTTTWWVLMNDIDMSAVTNWQPIGHTTSIDPWTGSFNGNGYSIKNLTIDTTLSASAHSRIGVWANLGAGDAGQLDDDIKVVHNLVLDNINITISGVDVPNWNIEAGILVGKSAGNIGSLDVEIDSITIINSIFTMDVAFLGTSRTAYTAIGGMSGISYRAGHIYVDVDISVHTDDREVSVQPFGIGGIMGVSGNGLRESAFVGRLTFVSDQLGTSSGSSMPIGGLIGKMDVGATNDSIVDCYVRSSYLEGDLWIGGLVGSNINQSNSRIKNCYVQLDTLISQWTWNTSDFDGQLIAQTEATGATWFTCYADTEAVLYDQTWDGAAFGTYDRSLNSFSETTTNGQDTAKTTAEMKLETTFYNWDFANIWEIDTEKNDGYPTLQWIVLFPRGPIFNYPEESGLVFRADSTILVHWTAGLDTPLTTSYLHYSVNGGVNWTLIDTLVATDTSYSWVIPDDPTTQGRVRITEEGNMVNQADSSSNNFTILAESTLDIYYPIEKEGQTINVGDTLHIKVESSFINDIWLYWSNDSTAWNFMDSTAVDTVNGQVLDSTTYIWTFDETVSGPEVWVWVTEQSDTALYYFVKDYNDLGVRYPRGIFQCQQDSGGTLIEFFVYYDPSCGWSQPAHTYYTSRIGDLGQSYDVIGTAYAHPYTGAHFSTSAPVDLVTGVDTVATLLNDFYSEYGDTVVYKNRRYYVLDQTLYADDLVNEIDSIVISDLSEQYSGTYPWVEGGEVLQVYHVQRTKISGETHASNTVWETLNDAWFEPLILISGTTSYPARTITVEALDYPANDNPAEDIQKVLTGSSFQRFHFRGIHPKIRKE